MGFWNKPTEEQMKSWMQGWDLRDAMKQMLYRAYEAGRNDLWDELDKRTQALEQLEEESANGNKVQDA